MTGARPDDDDALDPRHEHELRDALRRRDPGPAPIALRELVLDVPDRAPRRGGLDVRRGLSVVLGIAATVLVAVVGASVIGNLGRPGIVAATIVPLATPGAPLASSDLPTGFDPNVVGPGILASGNDGSGLGWLVVLAVGTGALFAISMHGRRWIVPAVVAVCLSVYALVASQVPVTIGINGYGPSLNVRAAPPVPGSSETLWYEVAPPGQPFAVSTLWGSDGPVPVRIDGVVSRSIAYGADFKAMQWMAVWTTAFEDVSLGGRETATAFSPADVPPEYLSLLLVGHAGWCGIGPAFDPSNATGVQGYMSTSTFDVQVSVLGWPRVLHVEAPFHLVEPSGGGQCWDNPPPSPSRSPSAP